MLETGIKHTQEIIVTEDLTADKIGSGKLPVYATPQMIALAENTASDSVAPYLAEGEGTVGTLVNIRHVSATPVGMKVRCETTLAEIVRKRLVFSVEVYDEAGLIGEGTHERFIIQNEKFMAKTEAKKQQNG